MDYTVIKTNDRWGYELRDSAGMYAGNALTVEQAERFALAEGAKLRFEHSAGRGGWTGASRIWAGLRGLTGKIRVPRDTGLVPEATGS